MEAALPGAPTTPAAATAAKEFAIGTTILQQPEGHLRRQQRQPPLEQVDRQTATANLETSGVLPQQIYLSKKSWATN
uniref:Uncharacterized protein n=1 Tax=Ditylenchus dipsaci TaxID=166011 RepID=A0A915CN28_9BILA